MVVKLAKKDQKILEESVKSINIATAMNEALWVGNRKHKTIYVNPMFEKMSGYSLDECIGKDCTFFFNEEGKKIINKQHGLRGQGRSSQYEATMITKDGQEVPLLISGCPAGDGGTMGIFTNLTTLKKLAEKDRFAKQVIQHSTEAIVILGHDRTIKLWNDGATRMLGYREEEAVNQHVSMLIPEERRGENEHFLQEVRRKGHLENIETQRLSKEGELIDVTVSVTKILGEKREIIGYLVMYRDITEQKRINTELQKRFETIQDAYKELGLQRRYIDYLSEIIETAVNNYTLEDLERLIVSAFSLITKCESSVLRYFEEDKQVLRLATTFGVNPKWHSKDQIDFKNSIAKDAFHNRRAIIIDDIDTYQKHQGLKLLKAHKLKALILIPLFVEEKFLGSISLYATDPAKFRLIETDFLERMGKQCALALFVKKTLHHVKIT